MLPKDRIGPPRVIVIPAQERLLSVQISAQLGIGLHPIAGVVDERASALVQNLRFDHATPAHRITVYGERGAHVHVGGHPATAEARVVREPEVDALVLGGAERIVGQVPETNLASPVGEDHVAPVALQASLDRKSTRLNSSHLVISYAVFCLKKKKKITDTT